MKESKKKAAYKHILSKRRMLIFIMLFPLLVVLCLLSADAYVGSSCHGQLYQNADKVPHCSAALILGCGKYVDGRINLYYQFRIDAAVELWKAGKIDAIVVSGDNSRKDYDEPGMMKADLVGRGVPEEFITQDCAGFRTLDSVVRAEKIFGLKNYIVVSQRFHCQRSVYLASQSGQSVIGYCAADVGGGAGLKIRVRESLARTKAVMDVIFSKSPKFLGKQEEVRYRT